jgi:hypothetical protein
MRDRQKSSLLFIIYNTKNSLDWGGIGDCGVLEDVEDCGRRKMSTATSCSAMCISPTVNEC